MKKKYYIIFGIILFIISSVFVIKYVKNEDPVYIFDYSGYYELYKTVSQLFIDNKHLYLSEIISSIRNLDYNFSPVILLLPFYYMFKTSRVGYILGLGILYVIPTIMLTIVLINNMILKKEKKLQINMLIFIITICTICSLYTRWWSPTLRGLPDIVALIPLMIATLLALKHPYSEKQKIYISVIIGFCIYLSFLFRRYFIYAIIGLYLSLFIIEFIKAFKNKDNKKEKYVNIIKNFMISGVTTLVCVLLIQTPLVIKILGENYSNSYSAFQLPLLSHITNIINEFGYIVIILSIIGLIFCIKNKEHRYNGLFCLLNILICYLTFMTVQAMGVHHFLTISPWIFILTSYGIWAIYSLIKNNVFKYAFLILIILLFAINFATTYIFRDTNIPIISQNNKYYKFKYDNFDELNRLIYDIDKLIGNDNVRFSVLASNENISDNLLDLLGTQNMKNHITYTSAIDLRDGINFNSLMSKYMVVTDKAQISISEEGQKIITVPNDEIFNHTSIGKAYKEVSGPYILQDGVKAYIYEKTRPFEEEEITEYMEKLISFHEEWKKYDAFDYSVLLSEVKLGETCCGEVKKYTENTFYLSPGYTPTYFTLNLNKKMDSISIKAYVDGNIDEYDKTAGSVLLTIITDDKEIYKEEITKEKNDNIQIDLKNVDKLTFIVDKNEYLNCDWLFLDILDKKERN